MHVDSQVGERKRLPSIVSGGWKVLIATVDLNAKKADFPAVGCGFSISVYYCGKTDMEGGERSLYAVWPHGWI
ncbi:hypothetical protein PZN02_005456 [Sinorhizobium garamanticum]|uniref:Uncharacterized protein n=1 Tax=Sinorhizobium garamanticum TaxID=680247 RepID=A0ABY8DMC0_9HYPH|nr:hypothetical protein [Sinorhizobium garamanticum]WEX90101.1 hypothetical protein PZN02_005456 [Sinorhizobium garamanticum]